MRLAGEGAGSPGAADGNLAFLGRAARAALAYAMPHEAGEGVTPYEVVFRRNKLRLLHYGTPEGVQDAPPVLLVYALVNRYPVMDLAAGRSVVRSLSEAGLDVYLLDWGAPTPLDARLTLDDYVNHYLDACVEQVRERTGADRVNLLGYCQGGTLSAMYAALHPERVKSLVLMAAPLDYDRDRGLLSFWVHRARYDAAPLAEALGVVPQELLDPAFVMLKPIANSLGKLRLLQRNLDDPRFVELYFRMESWIAHGVPQAGAAYAQFVRDVYLGNRLARDGVPLGARRARLADVRAPTLLLVAAYDHIVPPGETLGALPAFTGAHVDHLVYPAGHVGLSINPDAHEVVWPVIARWILEHARPDLERPRPVKEIAPMVFRGDDLALAERDILTLADIAGEDAERLSHKLNVPVERARLWTEEWRALSASLRRGKPVGESAAHGARRGGTKRTRASTASAPSPSG